MQHLLHILAPSASAVIAFAGLALVYAFFAFRAVSSSERLSTALQLFYLLIIAGSIGYALIAHIEKTAIISAV